MKDTASTAITGVLVDDLFGHASYRIGTYGLSALQPALLVLYGDNGSGKTTLLTLLYHVLSKEQDRGHRTKIARIPFRRFMVQLADGTEIAVTRDGPVVGAYRFSLSRQSGDTFSCVAVVGSDGNVSPATSEQARAEWDQTMEALSALNVALFYLPDHRRPEIDAAGSAGIDIDIEDFANVDSEQIPLFLARHRGRTERHVLDVAITSLNELIRTEALGAATVGEANINSIYADVAKRILTAKGETVSATAAQGRGLAEALNDLMKRSQPFSKLGLSPPLQLRELIQLVENAKSTTRRILASVLQPYVESVSARLNALAATQQLIESFVSSLNSFYTNKSITFSLRDGLQILQPDGVRLSPRALSSGEQQLMLLFCNTVRARAQATLFIVDEPELSLNVKWQRRLLHSLLGLVAGSQVQFIIATHSIELIAKHRSAVVRLTPAPLS